MSTSTSIVLIPITFDSAEYKTEKGVKKALRKRRLKSICPPVKIGDFWTVLIERPAEVCPSSQ